MIKVMIGSPPNRDGMVAELEFWRDDGVVDQPAEIFRENGRTMIALYSPGSKDPFEVPLGEFVEAIGHGIARLGW